MKKRNYVVAAASALALALTACGGSSTEETTTAAETTAEAADESAEETTAQAEDETTEESSVEGSSEGAEAESGSEAEEITAEDVTAFAEEAASAVMNEDIEKLADLVSFPVYVASATDNEGVVEDRESFVALGDSVFTESFVDAITSADLSSLEETEAGYVIGDGTPNIIFNVGEDGNLGITGINNQ